MTPTVSIIMPAYNMIACIDRAVASIQSQTLTTWELLIVDDASTDETWARICELAAQDDRIRPTRLTENGKAARASNVALKQAQGRWVAIVDADDWIHPDRLQTLVEIAEAGRFDVAADNQILYDAQADKLVGTVLPDQDRLEVLTLNKYLRHTLTGASRFDYGMLKLLVRTAMLREHDIWYQEGCFQGYDFHFLLDLLAAEAKVAVTHRPYYYYTQPYGSASRLPASSQRTAYNYSIMRAHTTQAIARYRTRLPRMAMALLTLRDRSILLYSTYLQAKDDIGRRDVVQGVKRLLRRPGSIVYGLLATLKRLGLMRSHFELRPDFPRHAQAAPPGA